MSSKIKILIKIIYVVLIVIVTPFFAVWFGGWIEDMHLFEKSASPALLQKSPKESSEYLACVEAAHVQYVKFLHDRSNPSIEEIKQGKDVYDTQEANCVQLWLEKQATIQRAQK